MKRSRGEEVKHLAKLMLDAINAAGPCVNCGKKFRTNDLIRKTGKRYIHAKTCRAAIEAN